MEDIDIRQAAIKQIGDLSYAFADLLAATRDAPEAESEDIRAVWQLASYRAKRREAWSMPINLLREKINADRKRFERALNS